MTEFFRIDSCIKILMDSNYPQFRLLSANGFQKYLAQRGMKLSQRELEYYDRIGIVRPALRLRLYSDPRKERRIIMKDTYTMKTYYNLNLIEIPQAGDFRPWSTYGYGDKELTTELFYHPYQFVLVDRLVLGNDIKLTPLDVVEIQDFQRFIEIRRKIINQRVQASQNASKNWIAKVGLLMLLENIYAYDLGSLLIEPGSNPREFMDKWIHWRLNIFNPENTLKVSKLSEDQVEELYKGLCHLGYSVDPLSNWYPLLQLIDTPKKNRLKNHALLAQEFYKLARMVAFFIYDLTKKKMPDPDDVLDGRSGSWKIEVYGEPFDYETVQTQKRILDNYMIDRPTRIALVYEGEAEDIAIKILFDVLKVDQQKDGIFLWNAKGQGNIKNNIHSLYALAKANGIDLFIILDRDSGWDRIVNNSIKYGFLKPDNYHVWIKDFETDNYDIAITLELINEKLESGSQKIIDRNTVENKLYKGTTGMYKAISDAMWEINNIELESIVPKSELARMVFQKRAKEIENDLIENGKSEPNLAIEHVLKRIFDDMGKFVG